MCPSDHYTGKEHSSPHRVPAGHGSSQEHSPHMKNLWGLKLQTCSHLSNLHCSSLKVISIHLGGLEVRNNCKRVSCDIIEIFPLHGDDHSLWLTLVIDGALTQLNWRGLSGAGPLPLCCWYIKAHIKQPGEKQCLVRQLWFITKYWQRRGNWHLTWLQMSYSSSWLEWTLLQACTTASWIDLALGVTLQQQENYYKRCTVNYNYTCSQRLQQKSCTKT